MIVRIFRILYAKHLDGRLTTTRVSEEGSADDISSPCLPELSRLKIVIARGETIVSFLWFGAGTRTSARTLQVFRLCICGGVAQYECVQIPAFLAPAIKPR
jgi:hypothetical protein